MPLILAIESDRRQVSHLTAIVRGKLHAELVLGETAEGALERLGDRVPDLILTSALLSPRDEHALTDRLRRLNGVAAHVHTLTLPVFGGPTPRTGAAGRGGVLSTLLGDRSQDSSPEGCDPSIFADQCKEYLQRAAAERQARQPEPVTTPSTPPSAATVQVSSEPEPTSIMAAVAAFEQTSAFEESPFVLDAPRVIEKEHLEHAAAERPARQPEPVTTSSALSAPPSAATAELASESPSIMAAVAALAEAIAADEPPLVFDAPRVIEAEAPPQVAVQPEANEASVDIDLSDLLEGIGDETAECASTDEAEPPVYELSAETIDVDAEPQAAPVAATPQAAPAPVAAAPPQDPVPVASEPPPVDDFDDWQNVVDALKRESANVRVPRERTRDADVRVQAAPKIAKAAPKAEPPRRRHGRAVKDEWGVFDPKQAGMAALYKRLEEITEDEEKPAKPA